MNSTPGSSHPRRVNQKKNPPPAVRRAALRQQIRASSRSATRISALRRARCRLEALIVKLGKTVSKQSSAESLFTMHDHAAPDAIEIYVSRLRRKLEHSERPRSSRCAGWVIC